MGGSTEIVHQGQVVETHDGDTLNFIEAYQKRFKVAIRPGMPRFAGGLAGYFGSDTVRHMAPRLGPAVTPFPAGQRQGDRRVGKERASPGRSRWRAVSAKKT